MAVAGALTAEKKTIRRKILARRARLYRPVRQRAALTRALDLLRRQPGLRVGLYAGFRDELDPMPLVRRLAAMGVTVGLPVVIGPGRPLVFRRYGVSTRFVRSTFGILEPAETAPEVLPDIVIAPLVGVDRSGARLGYGGGFYDRTMAAWRRRGHRPPLVGLAFETQLVPRLPAGRHDVRLDALITEAAYRSFG
jgi:5-formyltetrahydrofolate cyclo-ligase